MSISLGLCISILHFEIGIGGGADMQDNSRQYYYLNVFGQDTPGVGNELIAIVRLFLHPPASLEQCFHHLLQPLLVNWLYCTALTRPARRRLYQELPHHLFLLAQWLSRRRIPTALCQRREHVHWRCHGHSCSNTLYNR